MDFSWPVKDEDLLKALNRFQICEFEHPQAFSYTPFKQILQNGPQCGIVSVAMLCNLSSEQEIGNILNTAKTLNFTFNGEMFSAEDMCSLVKIYTNKKVELFNGNLACEEIKSFLLNKGIILVPYDADANHSPCLKNGHKAHWALISGIIITLENFVIARQGKSKYLGIWSLESLAISNSQLNEFDPKRDLDDLQYKLPEGGINGPKGLKNKCILIYSK